MKIRSTAIFSAFALMLAACALAAGIGKVEYATADLAKRTATVAWTWTDLADNAVRLSLTRNGEDFPTAGWGGTLFIGDGALGCAVSGVASGYNELLFDVGRESVPTNGKYAVQIIVTNTAGRVEEWARGTLTVRANPAADGMPTNWTAYADIARRVAPYIDAQGILSDPANADALWGAVSNRTDALIQAVSPTPDLTAYLRNDKQDGETQEFGGILSGLGFNVFHESSNFCGWNNYTARNGNMIAQALPDYIRSNPWGFYAGDLAPSTNYTDSVALSIRNDERLRSFVKDDGTVYYWITNGIWSTVNKHGEGWDDSYLAGARIYLWYNGGESTPVTTNWTWYLSGGPNSSSRTTAGGEDDEILRFKYSNSKTNFFIRGSALMYAENVGGMVSSRFNAASRITTNDVCNIVTNTTYGWSFSFSKQIPISAAEYAARYPLYWDGSMWNSADMSQPERGYTDFLSTQVVYRSFYNDSSTFVTATRPSAGEYNALGLARIVDLPPLTNGLVSVETDPTIAEWAKAANPPAYTASDVGAYPAADGTSLANIVNAWEGYWGGTNVIFEVTNYYGNTSGEFPRLRIKELREGSWQTVWDEANKFDVCASQIVAVVASSNAALKADIAEEYAPKAWGAYTDKGATNVVGNSVWMTSPETYFAGGTEYQRVAVGDGVICVLTENGASAYTAGEAGTFRFQDEGGTNYFGFAKSYSYTIGCRTDGITVSGNLVTLRYDVIMGGTDVPIVYYRQTLSSGEWEQLNNADGTACAGASYTVTWYTSGGSYYAAINCGSNSSGFFKAETSVAGDVVFETNMKARLGGGIECTNTQTGVMGVIRPSYNGSAVNWTWSAR